jgi:cell division protein FtsB
MENQLELTAAKKRAREDPDWVCSDNDSDAENVDVSALQQELAKLRKENQTLKKMLKQSNENQAVAVSFAPEMSAEAISNSAARVLKH